MENLGTGTIMFTLEKALRKKKMSKTALSKKTGIPLNTIKSYCNSLATVFDFREIARICDALNCNLCDIMEHRYD